MDLRVGLKHPPEELSEYETTSPPAVIGNLVIAGSAIADNNRAEAPSGEVRAFDTRTGALEAMDSLLRPQASRQARRMHGPSSPPIRIGSGVRPHRQRQPRLLRRPAPRK